MASMRRGAKRVATNSKKSKNPAQVARIRERREQIYQREGVLSDSATLIRE
jgi:hypothetical protein